MKYIIAFLFLISLHIATGQTPESDAVFEKIIKEYTLNKDGSIDYHYYKKLKLLTHYSFNRLYGETFIVYNPEYQELKINLSQTTHEDGKVTEGPFNSFNEVLPHFAAYAPYYNNLREMVVTHPGTEIGAVIELDYTLTSKPGYNPGLMADEIITETSPVADEEIIIRIPEGKKLNYKVFNIRTAPDIGNDNNQQVFTFKFKGIKESSHEAHQPSDDSHLPRVIFSTLTWDEALDAVFKNIPLDYKTNTAMQSLVKETRQKDRSDLSFVLDLNTNVSNDMNNYHIPWQYCGYTGRNPIQTWQSNGGTPLEKCLLYTALLREGGIHAVPVVVIPTELFDENTGCLLLVSKFLAQVNPRELEQMYLSVTETSGQNMIYRLNGNTLISLDPKQPRRETVDEDFENKVITNGNLKLDDSLKLSGNIEIMLSEAANPYYEIEKDSSTVKSLLKGISGKDIVSYKVINAAQYRTLANLVIESAGKPEPLAQYYFIDLPENKRGTSSWHINYLHGEREDPFEVPFVVDEEYSYEYTLPAKSRLVNPVELTEMKTSFGELVLSTTQKDNKVIIKRLLKINRRTFEVSEYDDFKKMFDLWNEENFRKLVLEID